MAETNKEVQELIKYIEDVISQSKEEKDITVLIETLTESLKTAIDVINSLNAAIDELIKENEFLADTIVNANYGRITIERRELLSELELAKQEKVEYELKLEKLTKYLTNSSCCEVKKCQSEHH